MRSPPQDVRRDDGFSLAEILITIVIVGISFTALLGGITTAIASSTLQREESTTDALARSGAEWVKDPVKNAWSPCATTGSYTLSGLPKPSGYSVTIQSVQNWNPPALPVPASYQPSFTSGSCTDHGLQLITIVATSPDSRVNYTVQVIKRTTS